MGSVFWLEKIPIEKNQNTRDLKLDSLDRFGSQIMDMYEPDESNEVDDESALLLSVKRPRNMVGDLVSLIKNEDEEIKERTFRDYAGRIKTYRLEKGELKRLVVNYEMDSDDDVSDEEKSNLSTF